MSDASQPQFGREKDIEQALAELGRQFMYPPTPDVAPGVRTALTSHARHARDPLPGIKSLRTAFLAALLALLVLAATVLAIGIGLRGLGIAFVDQLPDATEKLQLGEGLMLSEAQARVPYTIALPPAHLGEPEVFVDSLGTVEQVILLYRRDRAVDLLLTQFVAHLEMDVATKLIGSGTGVEELTVDGGRAFWIDGEPHVLYYRDASGATLQDRVRLVGSVLVWQKGDLTLRLEGLNDKAEAVRIAEAVE
ncbi:MAG: hypothetical protein M3253_02910 [Chloroflexota bacterium]|nr:hypothetical protein [Chloroflexota bacterium]